MKSPSNGNLWNGMEHDMLSMAEYKLRKEKKKMWEIIAKLSAVSPQKYNYL